MTIPELVAEYLPEVESFLETLNELDDEDARSDEYRRISKLVRFSRRFYEQFLRQEFDVHVTSFAFHDKRIVAEQIRAVEEKRNDKTSSLEDSKLSLAYRYLDICDQLHGDIDFGYSADAADFAEFHEETFPDWLDELAEWLKNDAQGDLAEKVTGLSGLYRRVV